MVRPSKEIQVQKPAQSLQAFQRKLEVDAKPQVGLLKPLLIGAGSVAAVVALFFGVRAYRANALEKHESAVAALVNEVQGTGLAPVAPVELEKRMREKLPALEALANSAPSAAKGTTQGLLNAWKLSLEGKGEAVTQGSDPWSQLRLAQRAVTLGDGDKAAALLAPLRKSAKAEEPWAPLYWATVLDLHRLKGDREQAWKDYAEYKERFKERADPGFEKVMASI